MSRATRLPRFLAIVFRGPIVLQAALVVAALTNMDPLGMRLFGLERGVVAADPAAEWPQFLGPSRNGISTEKGLIETWPADGPKELWRVPGGIGMSGISIHQGLALTLVQRDGKQKLVALDAASGKSRWEKDAAPAFTNAMGNGPRSTPTIAGDRVVVYTGEGILAAFSLADGKPLWSRNVLKDHKATMSDYGMACSPLVVDDQVVVMAGAAKAAVAAYRLKDAEPAWTAGAGRAGYSSPALLEVGGRKQIVAFGGDFALGIEPGKGDLLWSYPYETDFGCNIATPVAWEGKVFLSAGENHGSVLLSLKPQGKKFAAQVEWESHGPKSVMRNEWQTSLLLGNLLFGFDNVGGAGPVSHLNCVDIASHERIWQQVRFGKGNMIAADGRVWIVTIDGDFVMARVSSSGYEELGRKQLLNKTRQAPSLAGGLIYLRDDEEIVCLDVRAGK